MPDNVQKQDLRIMKTNKALVDAFPALLKRQNFAQLTVNDLCDEAVVSRATFYTHFDDKYNFLEYWLTDLKQKNMKENDTYKQMEMTVNQLAKENKVIIKNLVDTANTETLKILGECLLSVLNISVDKNDNGKRNPKYIILTNFCFGGIIYYLNWQIENKFPTDIQLMNTYFYDIVQQLLDWEPIQDIDLHL